MSDDPRKRNGHEAIVVPMPIERKAPPLIRPPVMPRWAADPDFKRLLADPVLQLISHANFTTEQTTDNTAQLVVLSRAVNKIGEYIEDRQDRETSKSYHEFDPALATVRELLRERVQSPDEPQFGEKQAVEFVDRVMELLKQRQQVKHDAALGRLVKRGFGWASLETLKYLLPSLLVAGAWFWHWLVTR